MFDFIFSRCIHGRNLHSRPRLYIAASVLLLTSSVAAGGGLQCAGERLREKSRELKPLIEAMGKARSAEDTQSLIAVVRQFDARTAAGARDAVALYWAARAHAEMLELHLAKNEKKQARAELEVAMQLVSRSLEIEESSSAAHALRADLYGHHIAFAGAFTRMFAGMKYGPKVDEDLKRAREIDPSDATVLVSTGKSLLFKPGFAGGSVEDALAKFMKAAELAPACSEARIWSGIALARFERWQEARAALDEALRLDPENAWAKRQRDQLGEKGKR